MESNSLNSTKPLSPYCHYVSLMSGHVSNIQETQRKLFQDGSKAKHFDQPLEFRKSWPNHLVHHRLWAQLGSCRPCLAGGHGTPCSHLAKQVLCARFWSSRVRLEDFKRPLVYRWFTASKCFNDVTWNVRNRLERCWKQPNITSKTPLRPSCLGDTAMDCSYDMLRHHDSWLEPTVLEHHKFDANHACKGICDKISVYSITILWQITSIRTLSANNCYGKINIDLSFLCFLTWMLAVQLAENLMELFFHVVRKVVRKELRSEQFGSHLNGKKQ